jgi:hypothetical protein
LRRRSDSVMQEFLRLTWTAAPKGMSIAERAVETTRITESGGMAVPYRWHVYFACVALALACNYVLGKDMAWDTLNYQLYLGFNALNDRFGEDYFAAGPLAYLNPYAYVPFYAMVRAGLPALLICSVFAVAHSIILWLSFELGVAVCPSKDARTRLFAGSCAVALAFMNPILMQQIGSCFADITTAELALGGWLLLADAVRLPRISRIICAGLILGAATALKLSNAVSAVSALAMFAMLPLGWRGRIRLGFLYGISLGMGFAIVSAPWSYRLEKVFGNPFFPMFNSVFRSPEFTTASMTNAYRFVPDSIGEALWRPFAMIDPAPMVHEELGAPDPRYAILVMLVILLVLRWGWRRLGRAKPPPSHPQLNASTRVLTALGCGLSLNWILWLYMSGNGRYVLTMACVAAAVIVGMLFRLLESRPKARNYILAMIFVTQAVQLYMGAEYRWNGAPWGGQWFDVSIPEKLKTEPNLYFTLGTQSNSFIAPFLAKDSGLINLAGGYTLNPEGANGARVRALFRRFSPNVRVIFVTARPFHNTEDRAPPPLVAGYLQGFALRPDMDDCDTIAIHGLSPELEIRFQSSLPQEPQNRDTTYLSTCRVVPDTTDRSALIARQRAVNLVFDRLEDACPKLFQPRRLVTVHYASVWRRIYGATDIVAWITYGRVRFSDQIRHSGIIDVGSESDWAKAPLRLDCGRRNGVYFAQVLQTSR